MATTLTGGGAHDSLSTETVSEWSLWGEPLGMDEAAAADPVGHVAPEGDPASAGPLADSDVLASTPPDVDPVVSGAPEPATHEAGEVFLERDASSPLDNDLIAQEATRRDRDWLIARIEGFSEGHSATPDHAIAHPEPLLPAARHVDDAPPAAAPTEPDRQEEEVQPSDIVHPDIVPLGTRSVELEPLSTPATPAATGDGAVESSGPEPAREPAQVDRAASLAATDGPPANLEAATAEPGEPASQPPPRQRLRRHAVRALRATGYATGAYFVLVLSLISAYRWINPPASAHMLFEAALGAGATHRWMPLDEISPHLVRAVLVAEDSRFCRHWGIDPEAVRRAIENASSAYPRGASTISMQVTKNLFLWQAKSYLRKLIELPLTLLMELVWPKSRILEVYLNIAEWGPGVFGAEAAARHHFGKPASQLSEREAAQLAAALPNPRLRDAGDPGPRLQKKSGIVQRRVRAEETPMDCLDNGDRSGVWPEIRSGGSRGLPL